MPLNDNALVFMASAAQTGALKFAQLHSADAGDANTANIITAVGRVAVSWATPTGPGNFVLLTKIDFTGGSPGQQVYSLTLWDNATIGSGVCYGQFVSASDRVFDASGNYSWTMLDLNGSAA